MDDIPSAEDVVGFNFFKYNYDFIDNALVGEFARRSIKKYEKNV